MSVLLKSLCQAGFCQAYIRMSKTYLNIPLGLRIKGLKTSAAVKFKPSVAKCKMTRHTQQSIPDEPNQRKTKKIVFYVLFITACSLGYHAFVHLTSKPTKKAAKKTKQLSKYTADDVKCHSSVKSGVWVTLGHAVYDVTDYVGTHPGGDIILMAAGGALDPFWEKYPIHKQKETEDILQEFKIGVIPMDESNKLVNEAVKLIETVPGLVRLKVKAEDYRLQIESEGKTVGTFTVEDIRSRFPKQDMQATEKCAAKTEMRTEKPVWSGALLKDVLERSGADLDSYNIHHIQFKGLDEGFTVSVPLDTVLKEQSRVLLAYERDGEELEPKHGYPLRVLIPADTGFKSVKWLGKIVISEEK